MLRYNISYSIAGTQALQKLRFNSTLIVILFNLVMTIYTSLQFNHKSKTQKKCDYFTGRFMVVLLAFYTISFARGA